MADLATHTLYHEAGHAIGYFLLGGVLNRIVAHHVKEGVGGQCQGTMPDNNSFNDAILDCLGVASERHFNGGEHMVWEKTADYRRACEAVGEERVPEAMAEARRLVAEHEAEIEAIVAALEASPDRELSGDEAKRVFEQHQRQRPQRQAAAAALGWRCPDLSGLLPTPPEQKIAYEPYTQKEWKAKLIVSLALFALALLWMHHPWLWFTAVSTTCTTGGA